MVALSLRPTALHPLALSLGLLAQQNLHVACYNSLWFPRHELRETLASLRSSLDLRSELAMFSQRPILFLEL